MRLWTYHPPGFSLTSGRIDHATSPYYHHTPGVADAYRRLWSLLNVPDGQIVWCYTRAGEFFATSILHIQWELDVPESEILRFVDDYAWTQIIGYKKYAPCQLKSQWDEEALQEFPDDEEARERYRREQLDKFWALQPPEGNWWSVLFVPRPDSDATRTSSALIRHPVDERWVEARREIRLAR